MPRRAVLALAVVAIQLAASVAGYAHDAAVHHAICPDDGELIDVPGASDDASDDARAPAWADDDDNLGSRSGEPARPRDHQHCALAPAVDDAIAPATHVAISAPAPACRLVSIAPSVPPPPRATRPL